MINNPLRVRVCSPSLVPYGTEKASPEQSSGPTGEVALTPSAFGLDLHTACQSLPICMLSDHFRTHRPPFCRLPVYCALCIYVRADDDKSPPNSLSNLDGIHQKVFTAWTNQSLSGFPRLSQDSPRAGGGWGGGGGGGV